MKTQLKKTYFKIVSTPSPIFDGPSALTSKTIEVYTKDLIKNHRYMYLDINEQSGVKLMQKCDEDDDDGESERINNHTFIVGLNSLSPRSRKSIGYIIKEKELTKLKKVSRDLIKSELDRSTQKLKKLIRVDRSVYKPKSLKPRIYKEMNPQELSCLMSRRQFQTLNDELKIKEKRISQRYKTNRHQEQTDHPTIFRNKVLLPTITRRNRLHK